MNATLKQQLEAFENGKYVDSSGREDRCFNFYDWFCRESSLEGKAKRLFAVVKRWVKERNTDTDKVYVFFKNNCPVNGPLYDDFRICDLETGNVIWTVIPKCGHSGKAEVWGRQNNFEGPIVTAENMTGIYKQSF
jgi:hypothetical protein